jgi:hypothetical protein
MSDGGQIKLHTAAELIAQMANQPAATPSKEAVAA